MSVMIEGKEYSGESYLTIDKSGIWLWHGITPMLKKEEGTFKVGREAGVVDFSVVDITIDIAMILLGIQEMEDAMDFRRNYKDKGPMLFKLEAVRGI